MKNINKIPSALLFAGYFFIKLKDSILHPLDGLPVPNFNNQYDSDML